MSWDDRMKDFEARRERARSMGGPERLARRRAEGRLNARERIAHLADAGSFMELGTFNVSDVAGAEERTPADSKVAGPRRPRSRGALGQAQGVPRAVGVGHPALRGRGPASRP